MLDDPEMRLLGLRGLYLEAERLDDHAAARHYAARAAEVAPQLQWASEATIEEKMAHGDWDGALQLVDARPTPSAERSAANRRRAVLLTAKAMDLLDTDGAAARAAAHEAVRLEPHFPPTAVVAAKTLFRQGDIRKGSRILETAWKAEPHPEIADLYIQARPADAPLDRLARASRLESLHPNHPESSLAVARAAFDAKEYATAREAVQAALRMQPREAGWLLLADIEEAETGNQGKVRQYLSRAMRAPRDPAWVADGVVSERWAPASPVTGRLDAFEWRPPVERLGQLIEQMEPEEEPVVPALVAPTGLHPEAEKIEQAAERRIETGPVAVNPEAVAAPEPGTAEHHDHEAPADGATDQADGAVPDDGPPARMPDDPGVEPRVQEKPERRFRLF
jgi:HemY protein